MKTSSDRRRERVLEATADKLESLSAAWFRALTFDEVEQLTGFDRAQISRDFGSKENLMLALIDHCVGVATTGRAWSQTYITPALQLLKVSGKSIQGRLQLIGDFHERELRSRGRLGSRMAIWALCRERADASERLQEIYRHYDELNMTVFNAVRSELESKGFSMREGFDPDEIVVATTAFTEGLAIRHSVDPERVPDGLTGTILTLVVEALFTKDPEPTLVGGDLSS